MDYSLRNWIELMKLENSLKTVSKEVDTKYVVAAIGKKLEPNFGVLFKKVKGYNTPIITGLAGSREMMAKSLNLTVEELMERFNNAISNTTPCEIVSSDNQAIKENIYIGKEVDIEKTLPACIHHEKDSGKYITAGMLIVKDPETGIRNVSIHRHEIKDKNHIGALILPRHTHHIFEKAEKKGNPLEIAIVIGVHPILLLSSQATTRIGIDEFEIAGSLMGEPLKMVKCETVDLEVPVECEFVIEGKILPNIRKDEGPFGEYPKTYGPKAPRHYIEITAITHRNNPIYHTIIPATMEHLLLGAIPREATMLQIIKQAVPNTLGVNLTPAGGCRYHVVIKIDKTHEGEAKNAAFAAFASSSEVKHVVVVDSDIDIFNSYDVEWAIANRVQSGRDIFIVNKAMGNKLDPSSSDGVSDKMGIDATIPLDSGVEGYEKMKIPMINELRIEDYID